MLGFALMIALWVASGLYGRRLATSREALEQLGPVQAVVQGPFWLRRALIWTTVALPPRLLDPAAAAAAVAAPRSPEVASVDDVPADASSAVHPAVAGDLDADVAPAAFAPELDEPAAHIEPAGTFADATEPFVTGDPLGASADNAVVREPVAEPAAVAAEIFAPVEPAVASYDEPTQSFVTVPERAPVEPPVSDTRDRAEQDLLTSPHPAVDRPKRLPGRPMLGTVKTICPTCATKRAHSRQALCGSCGQINPWLAEKWKVEVAAPTHEHDGVEDAAIVASQDLESDLDAALPNRPKRGTVKTACPTCAKTTRHSREGACANCHQPNHLLQAHWGLVSSAIEIDDRPVDETPAITLTPVQPAVPAKLPSRLPRARCGGCGRRALPDLHGNCAFCKAALEDPR